ncbi:unnamed protein product [Victoria cruziana]
MKQKQRTVVLYPSPGMGHLITMVEFGKLVHLRLRLPVTILLASPPFNLGDPVPYIKEVESSEHGISFHRLPSIDFPSQQRHAQHHEILIFEFINACNPHVKEALEYISRSVTILAFVIDFFCFSSMSVATGGLGLPVYIYYTSPAGTLAVFLFLTELHHQTDMDSRQLDEGVHIPGIPPLPSQDLPPPILDRKEVYYRFLEASTHLSRAHGFIVNTFDALEPRALKAISDGQCVPNGPTPPLYTIGPVISTGKKMERDEECLNWLDSQPERSVVFLSFGSLGRFPVDQLGEIADGLERSGQRFLWVVRGPAVESGPALLQGDPDPEVLLPQGFLERTRDRGLVVKSWAPQARVLNHTAVGGFVTHCGWNSVLESISAGVPMVAWPLYAEQHINRALLVKEMGLAVAVQEGPRGLVGAAEVERCVRLLVASEEGAGLRERMDMARVAAAAAVKEDGTSWASLLRLADGWGSAVRTEKGT